MKKQVIKRRGKQCALALLSVALLLSLAACGASQNNESPAAAQTQAAEAASTAADVAENAAEETATEPSLEKLAATEPAGYSFGAFQTADLDGNKVDESIFAQADYTMVNFWGTFCPPCIAEMPDLAKLQTELPENIQMIGLICDLYYEQETESIHQEAEAIVSEADVTYTNLLIWQDALQMINSFTAYVPTTFFVDSEGNLVGEPIIGADIDAYKDRIIALAK